MAIPLIDLKSEYLELRDEILPAIDGALESMQLFLGPNVQALEQEWASFCGTRFSIGVSNGTEALGLALRAMDVGSGDEVVTVSWTFFATIEAIIHVGATPVLVDIDPDTYCMDPAGLADAITEDTAAVIPVHVFGHPADMDAIKELCEPRGIGILEDAAQAHGAEYRGQKVGAIGDAAAFSFYMSKNLAGYGEGGIVTTSDPVIEQNVRRLRDHGQDGSGGFKCVGYNARLDEIQAAIVRIKLQRLADNNEKRRRNAALYNELLADEDVILPTVAEGCTHVYHLYTIRSGRRDAIAEALDASDIGYATHYAKPPHTHPACEPLGLCDVELSVTEQVAGEVISLPMYPDLSEEQIHEVCEVVKSVL
ncbi:MAG: DegT/DnrJ/EryC1/StrS family aminotransferase [Armatimonadota bacterium]